MERLTHDVNAIAGEAGLADVLDGSLDVGGFSLGMMDYAVPDGIGYKVTLSNVGDAIVATGTVVARVEGECVRCLEPAAMTVESEVEGYFALSEDSNLEGLEDDEYEFVPEDGIIDLTDYLLAAVMVEIPVTFVCKDDCKGLCPKCGCNRNFESCDCDQQIDEMNPFAVLKGFFDDDAAEGDDDTAPEDGDVDGGVSDDSGDSSVDDDPGDLAGREICDDGDDDFGQDWPEEEWLDADGGETR